jgi:hypothetical protein
MDTIMLAGMGVGAFLEGNSQSGKIDDIKSSITKINQTNSQLTDSYAALETTATENIDAMKQTIITYTQSKQALATELSDYRIDYNNSLKKLEYYGIAFVSFVFFSLLLKLFIPEGLWGLVKLAMGLGVSKPKPITS